MTKFYNIKLKYFPNGENLLINYSGGIPYNIEKKETSNSSYSVFCKTKDTIELVNKEFITNLTDEEKREKNILDSMHRTKTKIIDYSKSNIWEYFITITFDKQKIDRYDYDAITSRFSKKLNNLKTRYSPNLKYILVPELHKDGAYHFHGLISNIGDLELINSKRRDNLGRIIYNCPQFNLGFTQVTKVTDTKKVSSYITKYITKELVNSTFNKRKYWCSRNLQLPKVIISYFTDADKKEILEKIKPFIYFKKDLTTFINTDNGVVEKFTEYIYF